MKYCLLVFLNLGLFLPVYAQNMDSLAQQYGYESLDIFKELLAIPCDAQIPEQMEANIQWAESAFTQANFSTQRLQTSGIPLLLAARKSPDADAPTILVYLQLDGQPVDPAFWNQENPYEATLKKQDAEGGWKKLPWETLKTDKNPDLRIFARAASDAKGPVAMFLTALKIIDNEGMAIPFHLKIIMDFEEELGSPLLPQAVTDYADELRADYFLIMDGPMHASNQPTLTFGARGIATVTLTVYGPNFPQHSGHYGNYVPNPALQLSQLLASMKDEYGRVLIPAYYDGVVIDDEAKKVLRSVPDDEQALRYKIGIGRVDSVANSYQESIQYPSLNIRGLRSAWVGSEVRTIIPSSATAEIDVRLVMESDPDRLLGLIKEHIQSQGFTIVDHKPTGREKLMNEKVCRFESEVSYMAFRTDPYSPVGVWLSKALESAHGQSPIKIRTAGGSIPISPFVTTLGIPAVSVPTVNRDNNQHSPNENIRIGNYINGIKTMLSILTSELPAF